MNRKKIISFFSLKDSLDIGQKLFLLGIFFLPSALPIGAFLLLNALIISFVHNKEKILNCKWNYPIFLSIFLIFISSLYATYIINYEPSLEIKKWNIWLNLFNWIPILIAYLGFQTYLINDKQRDLFRAFLISGTLPVIISCFMQKFLSIHGPFDTLFGTIVWFNRPISDSNFNLTGLFNNRNYLGMWLTLCFPFSLSMLIFKKHVLLNRVILFLINSLILYFALLTSSRNALLGIIICFIFLLELKKLIRYSLYFFSGILIINYLIPNFSFLYDINLSNIIEINTFDKIFQPIKGFNYERIFIWKSALNFISQKPLLGWGSGTFPYIFHDQGTLVIPFKKLQSQHSHNLFFEMAYNFGLPLALLLSSTVLSILKKAIKNIKETKKFSFNYHLKKSWLISAVVILIAHLSDITYYDGKISLILATILACLKNISVENKSNSNKSQLS